MSTAAREMSYRAAINLGLAQGMERDPKAVSYPMGRMSAPMAASSKSREG
jgi:hypothetical protein